MSMKNYRRPTPVFVRRSKTRELLYDLLAICVVGVAVGVLFALGFTVGG